MSNPQEPLEQLRAQLEELRSLLAKIDNSSAPRPKRGELNLTKAVHARITALRAAAHRLETQISGLEARLEAADREAWHQKGKRAEMTARWKRAESLLEAIQSSPAWKAVKPLWKLLQRNSAEPSSAAPSKDFAFGIDAPAKWETASEIMLVRGWCLSLSGRHIAAVRGKIGKKGRLAAYGMQRADVVRAVGSKHSLRCGFTLEMPVPQGTSQLRLEAIVQGGDWEPFFDQMVARSDTAADPAKTTPEGKQLRAKKEKRPLPRLPGLTSKRAADLLRIRFAEHQQSSGSTDEVAFSIITPTYNTKPQWLAEAALSVLEQSFGNWEWCLVDDGSTDRELLRLLEQLGSAHRRVRVAFQENAGISAATNRALEMATGKFVCFLDHDDLLASDALARMQEKLSGGFDVVYSDEDKLEDASGARVEPFFKPAWSPEYLRGVMYVGHLLCVRCEIAQRVGFDSTYDGIQDFEFMLRVGESGANIGHLPEVLYHWRKTAGSIAENSDAKSGIDALQVRAVNAHLSRIGLPGRAETKLPHRLRIVPFAREKHPRVSIIIPSRDAPEHVGRCLRTLFGNTSYPDFEVIVMDNDTSDPDAVRILAEHPIRRIPFPGKFNFSRANNQGVAAAEGEFIVFLNNDTEIITPGWLQHLLYYAGQQDVGAAGALLVYDDRTVQHGGVALGMRGTADHLMRDFPMGVDGYAGSLACAREVSAVTAACMMMRKSLFHETGGFNERYFTAYQDLDLCLRLRARGLRVVHTPEAVVVHHEWTSRKTYYDMVDRMLLLDQWEPVIEAGDPYYNRNLNLERGDYSPASVA